MNRTFTHIFTAFLLFTILGSTGPIFADGGTVPGILCADTTSSTVHIEECADSFTLNGVTYTDGGNYTQTYTNAAGCDSTVYLFLTLKANKPMLAISLPHLATTEPYTTYQWYRNDTAIAGSDAPVHMLVAPEPGDYYYVVVNAAFCPDTSDYYIIPDSSVNVVEPSLQSQIKIYPNPTSDVLNIHAPIPITTQVFSADGRQWQIFPKASSISLEHLPQGVYWIRIANEKGHLIKVERVLRQ